MKNGDPPICRECERLGSRYQQAIAEHQRLLSRMQSEAGDATGAAMLIRQINAAESARKKAQEALTTHRISAGHE